MTDWEARYRGGDTPWEKGAPHPALPAWLRRNPFPGRVLVPGCGSGYDVRALAANGAEVTGLDVAPSAIQAAERFPRAGRENYALGNFFAPLPEWIGAFDGIFEHTCFCVIDPADRRAYAASAAKLLRPGGRLLAIFFLDPGNEGGGPPFGCAPAELDALFGPAFRLVSEERGFPTHPGREGREILRVLERREDPAREGGRPPA